MDEEGTTKAATTSATADGAAAAGGAGGEPVKEAVRTFIQSAVRAADLDDDADLFESGIVNSLFAVQLMTFIERTFAIEVGMDDLDMENFKSLNATTAFVLRKHGRPVD